MGKKRRQERVVRARQEKMEMGRSARDKREERTCLTLVSVDQKAKVFFAAEKIPRHSPFLLLAA